MTEKTIKLSDIYVKKSELNVPTKTSDLTNDGNGSNAYATVNQIPTVPSANSTASNIKMNGAQSAGNLSTYAKADHVHPKDSTKADEDHIHSGWVKKKEIGSSGDTLYVVLYVNEDLHLAYLRWYNEVWSVSEGKVYGGSNNPWTVSALNQSWIPEPYWPSFMATGAITWGTLFVTPEGHIQASFTRSSTNVTDLYGTVMWPYWS